MHNSTIPTHVVIFFLHYIFLLFYNCCVFIYSTVAGRKCEINIIVKSKVHRQTITRQISVYTPYVLQRPSKWLRRDFGSRQTGRRTDILQQRVKHDKLTLIHRANVFYVLDIIGYALRRRDVGPQFCQSQYKRKRQRCRGTLLIETLSAINQTTSIKVERSP